MMCLQVTHVLSVASECGQRFPGEFTYASLPLVDYSDENLLAALPEALTFIGEVLARALVLPASALSSHSHLAARTETSRRSGGRCLVHCVQGISRSASVVIAYLMHYKRWTYERALAFVKVRSADSRRVFTRTRVKSCCVDGRRGAPL